MALEFIPTRVGQPRGAVVDQLIERLRAASDGLGLADGVMYYGWPKFTDYEAIRHYVDLAVVSRRAGLILIRVLTAASAAKTAEVSDSLSQATATAVSQLLRSPLLRGRGRQLKVVVTPILFVPGYRGPASDDIDIIDSEAALVRHVASLEAPIEESEMVEVRSILEGAKALARSNRRIVENPEVQQFALALSKLEEEIASFDQRQRKPSC